MHGHWHEHGRRGWGGWPMLALMVLLWALLVVLMVSWWRHRDHRTEVGPPPPPPPSPAMTRPSAREILAERLARGEIDPDDYRNRLATLDASGPPSTPGT